MIKMIALDLDGTLAIDNHQVSPATREALTALHDGGVEVVIATGRRYRTTRYVIENLGFDVFAVCNGGALIKHADTETLHAETLLRPSQICRVRRCLMPSLPPKRRKRNGPAGPARNAPLCCAVGMI